MYVVVYLAILAALVIGSRVIRGQPASVTPEFGPLLNAAMRAAVAVIGALAVALLITTIVSELSPPPRQLTRVTPPDASNPNYLDRLIAPVFVMVLSTIFAWLYVMVVGGLGAIATYVILNDWSRLSTPRLVASGGTFGLLGGAPFGNLWIVATSIGAGLIGGLVFARRMRAVDSARGYSW
jgi:hypothetical protein